MRCGWSRLRLYPPALPSRCTPRPEPCVLQGVGKASMPYGQRYRRAGYVSKCNTERHASGKRPASRIEIADRSLLQKLSDGWIDPLRFVTGSDMSVLALQREHFGVRKAREVQGRLSIDRSVFQGLDDQHPG